MRNRSEIIRAAGAPWIVLGLWALAAAPLSADERGNEANEKRADSVQPDSDADGREASKQDRWVALVGTDRPFPVYRPPRRGAPRAKISGGARGSQGWPAPLTLAPEHLAHTISPAPSLFWHLASLPPSTAKIVFTLTEEEGTEPLMQVELEHPTQPGIQCVRLADYGVTLEREVEYRWSIALVRDPEVRSKDIIDTGYLRRVAEPPALGVRSAYTYSEMGLWYDALTTISDALEANPSDTRIREARDALLRQAGLAEAVEEADARMNLSPVSSRGSTE